MQRAAGVGVPCQSSTHLMKTSSMIHIGSVSLRQGFSSCLGVLYPPSAR